MIFILLCIVCIVHLSAVETCICCNWTNMAYSCAPDPQYVGDFNGEQITRHLEFINWLLNLLINSNVISYMCLLVAYLEGEDPFK